MTAYPSAGVLADDRSWYKTLNRNQWSTLVASNLGWMFDGFETYALILTAGPAYVIEGARSSA